MKQIQEWLGHSDIGTTMSIYSHLDFAEKAKIADGISELLPTSEEEEKTFVRNLFDSKSE